MSEAKASPARKRKPTSCHACGGNSYQGRVCKGCKKYYGTAEDAIAATALNRSLQGLTYEQVCEAMMKLVDVIVPDFPFCHTPHTPHPPCIPPRSARDTGANPSPEKGECDEAT